LLELEPLACAVQFALAFREVDGPQRHAAVEQVVLAYEPLGEQLPELQTVLLDEVVEDVPEGAAGQADLFERRAAGVERDDAPGIERRPFGVELVEVRVRERILAAELLRLA